MRARPPFGILLVTGGMTHQEGYAKDFQADPRCRVVGLTDEADVDERRARLNRELAAELGVPLLPDLDAALERDDVDAVSVCSEFERRAGVSEKCVRAGKHLYVDKPMATTAEAARSLVEAVEKAGVRSQMFTQVGQPYAQRAKRIIDSGRLGDLRAIHCDLLFAKGYAKGVELGKPRREHYPPRAFTFPDAKREVWTTAVYSLTLMRYLTGRKFRSVYATTANYFFKEHQSRDIEDFGIEKFVELCKARPHREPHRLALLSFVRPEPNQALRQRGQRTDRRARPSLGNCLGQPGLATSPA